MYRKILVTGVTAAAIVGVGGAALATTGSTTTGQPSPSNTSSSAKPGHTGDHQGKGGKGGGKGKLLKHMLHAQVVTKGKKGVVTHDLIKGTVTSVSPTSITVQAADKKSETFVVGKDTKIKSKTKGQKAATSTISKVAKGDHVLVAGTGTSTFTAEHIVDAGSK